MGDLRDPKKIVNQAKKLRIDPKKYSIDSWSLEEISDDLESLFKASLEDIQKLKKWNYHNKEAAKRVRDYTKAIDSLGTRFRVLSVKEV